MLSPLKPLLCRHAYYWSERHGSDRCRRCGKLQAGGALDAPMEEPLGAPFERRGVAEPAATPPGFDALPGYRPAEGVFLDFAKPRPSLRSPALIRPSTKVLKAQAAERRRMLLDMLDRLAHAARPTREEAIDVVLAIIEDAHSAEPVLFGPDAAGHFARLHEARSAPRC